VFGNATSPGWITTRPRPGLRLRPSSRTRPGLPLPDRLPRLLPELALLAAVYAGYKYGRKVANSDPGEAFRHAHAVWGFERTLHLPSERLVQRAVMHWEPVIHAANYLYATVHLPAMVLFLAYMFLRHRPHYLWIRRAIVIQTALALVGHILFPLAPPRLLHGSGMVDTAARYGPAVYGDKPQTHSMSNQFAAMPSLHVGWALAIAVGLIAAQRSRWRWLWLLHPLTTLLVVVSTANHYWVDCFVGCALLGVALLIIPGPPSPAATDVLPGLADALPRLADDRPKPADDRPKPAGDRLKPAGARPRNAGPGGGTSGGQAAPGRGPSRPGPAHRGDRPAQAGPGRPAPTRADPG
jgi:hypothetical protein